MFKGDTGIASLDAEYTGKFSAWDAEGMPTMLTGGEPVGKSALKKLKKEWDKQKKIFEPK